ncbi:MAG: ABC transporter ATP-binding protein [Pseudomonadota bacterium]
MNDASERPSRGAVVRRADPPVLALHEITRSFDQGGQELKVLRGVTLIVRPGEMVALVGPSGAGKSTLLQIAGLLEPPTSGEVYIDGAKCSRLGDGGRTRMRRERLGFVYQHHHLLPEFTALENVLAPQIIAGLSKREGKKRAAELLKMVGLDDRMTHRPSQLSGGQQQRVAIARALANAPAVMIADEPTGNLDPNAPAVMIADEPTGNLDPNTAESVFAILRSLVKSVKLAALIATHNLELAARMDRVLVMRDGVVKEA